MSIEKPKSNEPTPEDEDRAYETMTDAQKSLSFEREASANSLKGLGVEGHLERKRWTQDDREGGPVERFDTLEGEINGHVIKLRADRKGSNRFMSEYHVVNASGTRDGNSLSEKEAVDLWNTYAVAATPHGVEAGETGVDEVKEFSSRRPNEKEKK